MNTELLHRLKRGTELSRRSRLDQLGRLPWRLAFPYFLARAGFMRHAKAATFFRRPMLVVLPEVVSVSIWRYGVFEYDVAFYILSLLRAGDTFIDVGGHFGFFSMLGRELVGAEGWVVTFEPMPDTRSILEENMRRFAALAHHRVVPAAAGAAPSKLPFKDFGLAGSAYATSTVERSKSVVQQGEVEVDVRTIDSVVEDLDLTTCRLIKIDAENAEHDVVQGALGAIRRLRPAVIIETGDIDEEGGSSTRKVVDVLIGEGYQPFEFHDWTIRPHAVTESYGYQNLLLVPAELREELLASRCR